MRSETTDRTLRYLRTLRNWLHPTFQAEFIAVIDAEIDALLAQDDIPAIDAMTAAALDYLDTLSARLDAVTLEAETSEWRDEQQTREINRPL